MSPVLILIFIFCYVPMYGLLISFQDWTPGMPFMDFTGQTKWVGLKHFSTFVHDPYFWRLIKNTLVLSAMNLGIAFWIPIIFSLLINEVRLVKFKKFAQTASYLPYFISSVVVAGMALSFLSSDGIINKFIMMMGGEPFLLNMKPQYFPIVYTVINIWRNFGWGSILYLSSMASIDPTLYEAASLDGANKWQIFWNVTLPQLRPTTFFVVIMLTINSFKVYDQMYMITQGGPGNATMTLVYDIYNVAFVNTPRYGYASAISMVLFVLVLIVTIVQFKGSSND